MLSKLISVSQLPGSRVMNSLSSQKILLSSAGLFSLSVNGGEFYTFNPLLVSNYQGSRKGPWLCDLTACSSRVVSEWHTWGPDFSLWCLFLVSHVMCGAKVKIYVCFSEGGGNNRVPKTLSLYTGTGINFKINWL